MVLPNDGAVGEKERSVSRRIRFLHSPDHCLYIYLLVESAKKSAGADQTMVDEPFCEVHGKLDQSLTDAARVWRFSPVWIQYINFG